MEKNTRVELTEERVREIARGELCANILPPVRAKQSSPYIHTGQEQPDNVLAPQRIRFLDYLNSLLDQGTEQ